MTGIWISPTQHLDFSDETIDRKRLGQQIATRERAWDWTGSLGLLPDPDPVLRKLPDGGVSVLESLTADAHLCSVIQTRKLGTLKKEYRFEPGGYGTDKPTRAARALCAALAEDLERVDLYNLISGLLDAPLFGMSPVELVWRSEAGRLRLDDLKVLPARWFGFDEANTPRFVSRSNPWTGEELPFGKFVMCRHFPTYDNPFGLRLLSRCFWPVAFKRGGVRFWVTFAEKFGMPFLVGKYARGTSKPEQDAMLANLDAMVRSAVAVIPEGGSVEILESGKGGASAEIHAGLKSAMDAEMSKAVMGQTLTAEVGETGSYAASKTHGEVLDDFRDGDQTLVKTAMEEIAWLYGQVNAPGVPTPKFVWHEEDEPKKEFSERDKNLTDTGLKFTKAYYMRTYSLNDDDFELAQPQGEPPAAGAKAPGKSEFAGPLEARFADQDALDRGIEALSAEALQAAVEPMLRPLIARVSAGDSPERLLEDLAGAYPEMDTAALEEMLARAIFVAEIWGRLNARD